MFFERILIDKNLKNFPLNENEEVRSENFSLFRSFLLLPLQVQTSAQEVYRKLKLKSLFYLIN